MMQDSFEDDFSNSNESGKIQNNLKNILQKSKNPLNSHESSGDGSLDLARENQLEYAPQDVYM